MTVLKVDWEKDCSLSKLYILKSYLCTELHLENNNLIIYMGTMSTTSNIYDTFMNQVLNALLNGHNDGIRMEFHSTFEILSTLSTP